MDNVILINAIDFENKKSCNPFSAPNDADAIKSKISILEQHLSDKYNSISKNNLKLRYQRKYKYDVIGKDGNNLGNSEFGAYFFENSDESTQYRVCLGPVIELPVKREKFCNNSVQKEEEEKEKGCNLSSNKEKKMSGCNPSVTGEQHINFYNNEKNNEFVKSINDKNGWRKEFIQSLHDFKFTSYFTWNQTVLKINIEDYYDFIINAANDYVENLSKENLKYECNLILPFNSDIKENKVLENVILCSNTSQQNFYIDRTNNKSAYISAFDLLYISKNDWLKKLSALPKIGGIFSTIRQLILLAKKILGKKSTISDISNENLNKLTQLYSTEFTEQINDIKTLEKLKENKIGTINVFVLIPLWKNNFGLSWRKMFRIKLHKMITFEVDLTRK